MQSSDVPEQQFQIPNGAKVVSGDDHSLGKVTGSDTETITVEHGLLSKTELLVPRVAITRYDPDENIVYLSVSRDDALAYRWDARAD